jgi:predicted regulator of Ras-like GTPase activity (Roadblock/LC7/MglB family)
VTNAGIEFGRILAEMTKASDSLGTGLLREAVVSLARVTLIFHRVDEETILALALRPDGNLGKARYLIRRNVPGIRAEL